MSDAYNGSIDTELQVRLMNLVMGEASDFERDQLQLLMEQRAEVAAYYQHLEHLHGLLCEVGAGDPTINNDPASPAEDWQLPADRRAQVLAVLDSQKSSNQPDKVALANESKPKRWRMSAAQIAVIALSACVLMGLMLPAVQSARESARRAALLGRREMNLSLATVNDFQPQPSMAGGTSSAFESTESSPDTTFERRPAKPSSDSLEQEQAVTVTEIPGFASAKNLGAALGRALSSEQKDNSQQPSNYFDSEETLRQREAAFERMRDSELADNAAGRTQVTVPDGGTIILGGIKNFREGSLKGDATYQRDTSGELMMTVTPSIVLQEEDEVRYGDDFRSYRHVPAPVAAQNAAQSARETQNQKRGEVGRQSKEIAESIDLSGNGRNALSDMEYETVKQQVEKNLVSAFDAVERAATPTEEPTVTYPDVTTWQSLNRRKERDGDVSTSGKPAAETADFDTLQSLVEKTIDPDSWLDAGGTNTPNVYPSTLSAATSAPADRYLEASKDTAPEVGAGTKKSGEGASKPDSPKEQPADQNVLFGDVQVEFIEPIDLAIVRGSKADVERTLEVIDQVKGLPESQKTGQLKQLSDASKKYSVNEVVDLRELEKSERRLKASQVFEAPDDQTRQPNPKIDVRRPDELQDSSGELKFGKEVTPNGTSVPGLMQSSRELAGKDALSPNSESDTKKANLEAKASKLERTLEETRKELSLEQADRTSAVAPSPEVASSMRGNVTWGGKPAAQKKAISIDEQFASKEPFSTFSLHVSDVAFKLAQTALSQGQWPDAAKIRIEEFVNALDYHDPLPTGDQKVACRVEQAIHPFMMQRNLLRVSMRTAATGRSQNTPLRLTLLLDNSGSMERPDRRQAVLRAFQALTQQLSDKDQITLISFASTPRLLADKVAGDQGETLLQLVENLPSEGGTNIEAALMLAREKAAEQQVAGAQNRIVLLTDGAVNLGNANPESLAKLVTGMRDAGIAFDAAGISAQDLNDEVLEALTRQGDGRYYLLDSAESIGEKFAAQIAGALRPSAQNVKVQVEFNPQRVGRYKLLGFEKHRLNKEDFRNDKVDAAEMAAAEAGVAVYQYEIKPNGTGDVGSVSVRFRDVSTGKMIENRWPIPYESNSPRLDQSEPSMQLAASAAMLAAKLSGGPLGDSVDLTLLQKMLANLPEQCTSQPRVQQLRTMIEQAIAIAK